MKGPDMPALVKVVECWDDVSIIPGITQAHPHKDLLIRKLGVWRVVDPQVSLHRALELVQVQLLQADAKTRRVCPGKDSGNIY